MGDPQVPGDPADYNYALTDEGVAIHGDTLYFADTGDDKVAVIDAATLNPKNYNPAETDIHVGINPDDVAVTPDGTPGVGGRHRSADRPGVADGHHRDLDRHGQGDRDAAAARPPAAQIAFSPSGATAYVTTATGLWVFDTATDQVTRSSGASVTRTASRSPRTASTVYVTNTDQEWWT